jgi:hypothetical protein
MPKLVEFDVEIRRCDGSIANAKMGWQSLTKGQRVEVPVNDRDWSHADVIEVIKQISEPNAESYRAIVREVAATP